MQSILTLMRGVLMTTAALSSVDGATHATTQPTGAFDASAESPIAGQENKLMRREINAHSASHAILAGLDVAAKQRLWVELTKELQHIHGFPVDHIPKTGLRVSIDDFNSRVGRGFAANHAEQQCAETGDGHFLRADFSKACNHMLILDKFDPNADVKLDLDLPPNQAPEAIKAARGTIDLLLTHQVFEHLSRPSVGIANLNALMKVGGQLVFSTPFSVPDHRSPKDYFRYTVRSVHVLLTCAGFEVQELRGLGNRLTDLAYLAGVDSSELDAHDIDEECDGLTTDYCSNQHYGVVGAVSTKKEEKTLEQIHACFG